MTDDTESLVQRLEYADMPVYLIRTIVFEMMAPVAFKDPGGGIPLTHEVTESLTPIGLLNKKLEFAYSFTDAKVTFGAHIK